MGRSTSYAIVLIAILVTNFPRAASAVAINAGFISTIKVLKPLTLLPLCRDLVIPEPDGGLFGIALHYDSTMPRALLGSGLSDWLSGRCMRAVTKWNHAVELRPKDRFLWFYAGHGYLANGQREQAVEAFRRSEAWVDLYKRGQEAENQGDIHKAVEWYELAVAVKPTLKILDGLIPLYDRMGKRDAAIAAWQRLVEEAPYGSAEYWWALGSAAVLKGDFNGAIRADEEGAKVAGDPYQFYERIGSSLEAMNEPYAAIEAYKVAMEIRPRQLQPYLYVGRVMNGLNKADEARHWFVKAEEVSPLSDQPKLYLGLLAESHGEYDQSIDYLLQASALNPKNDVVLYHLAEVSHSQGKLILAIDYMKQALSISPKVDWWVILGDWYIQVGNRTEAILTYQRALELNSGYLPAIERLRSSNYP